MATITRHPDGKIEVQMDQAEYQVYLQEQLKVLIQMKKLIMEEARSQMKRQGMGPDPSGMPPIIGTVATKIFDTLFGPMFDGAATGYDHSGRKVLEIFEDGEGNYYDQDGEYVDVDFAPPRRGRRGRN